VNRLDFPYHETYLPAMAVLSVAVDGYTDLAMQQVTALVDSGADGTMIPIDVLETVGALYEDTVIMRGVLGVGEPVDRYTVAIQLGPLSIHGIRAVAIPTGEEAILGRDVLNNLAVTLNGPAHVTQVSVD
jgi:hypothetical protein